MSHQEKAIELFKEGYNCAQAVVGAFQEEMNVDRETALRLASSFGGGMGRLREVCGAVSGMFIVAGVLYGYDDPCSRDAKKEHYKRIQELAEKFRKKNQSIVCRDLLGLDKNNNDYIPSKRTKDYYEKRPCAELVGEAARIMEDYIKDSLNTKI